MYRFPIWYILIKTILNLTGEGKYFDPILYWQYLIYLAVVIFERFIFSLLMFHRLKKIETIWSRKDIHRVKHYNKQYLWKQVQVFDLKIGDIVKLKEGSICPVDLLVLDTSQYRYAEKIIYANESKITGKSRIKVKIAVKAIREIFHRTKSDSVEEATDNLKTLMQSMNGYIEYDPPTANLYTVKGLIKFKNDPKVNLFSNNNVMFFGSKLHSEWMIGMVLYNGKNVQILRKNFKINDRDTMKVKKGHFLFKKLNQLTVWVFGTSIVLAILLISTLYMSNHTISHVILIENQTFGRNYLLRISLV
jgi:magnesium-transporting ATPase (P-type)